MIHTETPHTLINEQVAINSTFNLNATTTGINIGDWTITCTKGPILNSHEMDTLQEQMTTPVPDMVFGHSRILFLHRTSGKQIEFNAVDALKQVDHTPHKTLTLPYSEEWISQRQGHKEYICAKIKPYDWTFTTEYTGTLSENIQLDNEATPIDIEKLKRPDPILYYNEAVLYEDELADNGMATLSIRLRVMPNAFFVLMRYFLRVDNLIYRLRDHRFYHEFDQSQVTIESLVSEAPYQSIKDMLPKVPSWENLRMGHDGEDIRLLTDQNWVCSMMPNPTNGLEGYTFNRQSFHV